MYGLSAETFQFDEGQCKDWPVQLLTHHNMFLCSGFVAEARYLGVDAMALNNLGDLAEVERLTMTYYENSVDAAQRHLNRIKPLVEGLLEARWHDLERIASGLLENGRLSGLDIEELLHQGEAPEPTGSEAA